MARPRTVIHLGLDPLEKPDVRPGWWPARVGPGAGWREQDGKEGSKEKAAGDAQDGSPWAQGTSPVPVGGTYCFPSASISSTSLSTTIRSALGAGASGLSTT